MAWHYNGDINVEYGGSWVNLDNWEHDYCECVRVTDLDSGCGATGMVMIEHVVILLNKDKWIDALNCCGLSVGELLAMDSDSRKLCLADCLLSYGFYDPDESWNGYSRHWCEVIQTEQNEPLNQEGFKATKRVYCDNLRGYIESEHIQS